MSNIPEALLGDKVSFEDHVADNAVLMKGGGVLAMWEAAGVFPDTADAVMVASWFDRLHNALLNIAAEDVELTLYQCRGEADPSVYEGGQHRSQFARDLDTAYRDNLFRNTLYANRLFIALEVHAPNVAAQGVARFLSDAATDPLAGINDRLARLNDLGDLLQSQLAAFGSAPAGVCDARLCGVQRDRRSARVRADRAVAPDRRHDGPAGQCDVQREHPFSQQAHRIPRRRRAGLRRGLYLQGISSRRPGRACSTGWRWRPTATRWRSRIGSCRMPRR